MNAIDAILDASPVMAVVTIDDAAKAVDLANALLAGGARVIEITLRTPAAMSAVRAVASHVPDMIVGAGTVLNVQDYQSAADAGARFAVSPGATPKLLDATQGGPIPLLPGIATASELMAGLERGCSRFKFFPAESAGGVNALKALAGPFADARFCPTGGITQDSAPAYLALPSVACVGGSWLAPPGLIDAGDWSTIERHARMAERLSMKDR